MKILDNGRDILHKRKIACSILMNTVPLKQFSHPNLGAHEFETLNQEKTCHWCLCPYL